MNILGDISGLESLDLAAGTGKWSAFLVSHAAVVTAVEPDPSMRLFLSKKLPSLNTHDALAEALPFRDSSFDLAVAGCSWHWFDKVKALNEISRTLKSNGSVLIAWNRIQRDIPWCSELLSSWLGEPSMRRTTRTAANDLSRHASFCEVKDFLIPWTWERSVEELCGYIGTRLKYCSLHDSAWRDSFDDMRREIVSKHGERPIALPMLLQGTYARRTEF